MASWRSGYSPEYLLVLTHRVIGSSPVFFFCFFFHHQPFKLFFYLFNSFLLDIY